MPAGIDEVCCQVLLPDGHGGHHGPPLTTPATLATALNRVIPAPAAPPPLTSPGTYPTELDRSGYRARPPYRQQRSGGPPRRGSRGRNTMPGGRQPVATRVMASIAVVLVAAAVGVGVWTLGQHGSTPHPAARPPSSPPTAAPPLTVLTAASAAAFGPNGGDNGAQAPLAIDNSPATDWTTDSYQGSAHFGNLYGGTGLVLDMGKQVTVSSVAVTFGSVPGAHVRVEVGNNNSGTSPAGATTLGHTSNAINTVTLHRASGKGPVRVHLVHQAGTPARLARALPGGRLQRRREGIVLTTVPGEQPPDAELLRRHVDGDADAFGLLFTRH